MVAVAYMNASHKVLSALGIDMDNIQVWVFKNCPEYNMIGGIKASIVFTIMWYLVFALLHYVMIPLVMGMKRKAWPSVEHWDKMDKKEKMWYTSYLHGIIHAIFSTLGSYYCFFYADGKVGTTYFTDYEYRHTMFDIQKYLHAFSVGYIFYDLFFCIAVAKMDALMLQTFFHHAATLLGNIGGTYVGGFLGSISQLTWISEGSTPFVNFRQTLAWHKQSASKLYLYNGLMMLFSFFFFRVIYYSYMVFFMIIPFVSSSSNWSQYPSSQHAFVVFLIVAYLAMYGLNLFWFNKILMGALKALGIVKKTPKKVDQKEN